MAPAAAITRRAHENTGIKVRVFPLVFTFALTPGGRARLPGCLRVGGEVEGGGGRARERQPVKFKVIRYVLGSE